MTKTCGFLKRSQEFRNDEKNRKYFSILDSLSNVASENGNDLPSYFEISNFSLVSTEDVSYVLVRLYPEKHYYCTQLKNCIHCVRY